ncbi:MATE domain protein, partial [Actinomyces sp. ICM58]|uniref:MATE family efflux transporter n=1 Tax=Actinomyces sp. ICM58 TaxID=1105030 RepID=UPI00027720A0
MNSNRGAATPSSPSPDEGATASSMPTITTGKILSLALPSLGALIAEPLFTVIDSTMVGHLGTPQLAGLGIASTVLNTAVGLFIFLAYSTTSLAGRHLGAGRRDLAIRSGVEAMWLAGGLGACAAILLAIFASPLLTWLGADAA